MRTQGMLMIVLFVLAGCATPNRVEAPGSYYLQADAADVRLGASRTAKITNRINRQQRVDVFEVKGRWARISKYYDGRVEGVEGRVARWVPVLLLSAERPPDLEQPRRPRDPRIKGMPKVGESGLTRRDVEILYRGATHFLQSGRCKEIEFGDKSTSRRDTYYVNCGGPQNLFFREGDIPES